MQGTDLSEHIKTIDQLIRTAEWDLAQKHFRKILRSKISRRFLAQVAQLAKRLGVPKIGVRLLNPIVHTKNRGVTEPTHLEIAEYASCLANLGADKEALKLLNSIPSQGNPSVLHAKTLALVMQWDYRSTIPVLEEYLSLSGIDSYQRLIGEANLVAALVYERQHDRAEPLLEELKQKTEGSYQFLYGKILDISAQSKFLQGDLSTTERELKLAEKALGENHGLDRFFIRKWRAFLNLQREPHSKKSLHEVVLIREEAISYKHWGTLRQCDYYEAIITKNKELFLKVYFGTPFESIRRHLVQDWKAPIEIPKVYHWHLGSVAKNVTILTPFSDIESKISHELKAGQSIHLLLLAFAKDFYSPLSIPALHYSLHPDEYYNSNSTPQSVRKAISRFRKVIANHYSPLCLLESAHEYRLQAKKPCVLEVPLNREVSNRRSLIKESISKDFGSNTFTSKELSQRLNVNPSTALKLLQTLVKEEVVEKTGGNKNARYRVVA